MSEEPSGLVDGRIEGQPGAGAIQRVRPLAQEERFAESGWSAHEGECVLEAVIELSGQTAARQRTLRGCGPMEENRADAQRASQRRRCRIINHASERVRRCRGDRRMMPLVPMSPPQHPQCSPFKSSWTRRRSMNNVSPACLGPLIITERLDRSTTMPPAGTHIGAGVKCAVTTQLPDGEDVVHRRCCRCPAWSGSKHSTRGATCPKRPGAMLSKATLPRWKHPKWREMSSSRLLQTIRALGARPTWPRCSPPCC